MKSKEKKNENLMFDVDKCKVDEWERSPVLNSVVYTMGNSIQKIQWFLVDSETLLSLKFCNPF